MTCKRLFISLLTLFLFSCGTFSKKKTDEVIILKGNVTFEIYDTKGAEKKSIGTRSLGNARKGETLNDNFAIVNIGEKIAIIDDVTTNCGCIKLSYDKKPIKKGEKSVISYKYDTRGKNGSQFSEIVVKTNIGSYVVLIDLEIK